MKKPFLPPGSLVEIETSKETPKQKGFTYEDGLLIHPGVRKMAREILNHDPKIKLFTAQNDFLAHPKLAQKKLAHTAKKPKGQFTSIKDDLLIHPEARGFIKKNLLPPGRIVDPVLDNLEFNMVKKQMLLVKEKDTGQLKTGLANNPLINGCIKWNN